MAKNKTDDFREKEVINVCDGRRLGYVIEIEFDVCDGRITAIIADGGGCFGRGESICIPWDQIQKIGEDIILVDASGCCPPASFSENKGKRKWGFI